MIKKYWDLFVIILFKGVYVRPGIMATCVSTQPNGVWTRRVRTVAPARSWLMVSLVLVRPRTQEHIVRSGQGSSIYFAKDIKVNYNICMSVFYGSAGADPEGGGGVVTPPALDHQGFFSTNFLTIATTTKIARNILWTLCTLIWCLSTLDPPSARAPKAPAVHGRRWPPPCKKYWIRACSDIYSGSKHKRRA